MEKWLEITSQELPQVFLRKKLRTPHSTFRECFGGATIKAIAILNRITGLTKVPSITPKTKDEFRLPIEAEPNKDTLVFPNPSYQSFIIKTEGKFPYQIADLQGKIIDKSTCNDSCETPNQLPEGTYFLSISKKNKKIQTVKIIKN